MNIRIMADYGSTGFWERGTCIDAPEWIPYHLKMLVKYWHDYWEGMMSRYDYLEMGGESPLIDKEYLDKDRHRWERDRSFIVEALNNAAIPGVRFI